MRKGRIEGRQAITTGRFGNDCHKGHEDSYETVLKDSKVDDLRRDQDQRGRVRQMKSYIKPGQSTPRCPPQVWATSPKPTERPDPTSRFQAPEVVFLTVKIGRNIMAE